MKNKKKTKRAIRKKKKEEPKNRSANDYAEALMELWSGLKDEDLMI